MVLGMFLAVGVYSTLDFISDHRLGELAYMYTTPVETCSKGQQAVKTVNLLCEWLTRFKWVRCRGCSVDTHTTDVLFRPQIIPGCQMVNKCLTKLAKQFPSVSSCNFMFCYYNNMYCSVIQRNRID